MVLKSSIVAEIERISGDQLTVEIREKIAERAIKLMEDYNREVAVAAIASVKHILTEAADKSAILETVEKTDQAKTDQDRSAGSLK